MVKQNNQMRQAPATDRSSTASGNYGDNVFCVVLHVVEAINFYGCDTTGERDQIVMNAALNTVDFEVEGTPSLTNETIIFNSNCIWECDIAGIKRIKTDNRPVKMSFFACNGTEKRRTIGSLLLPLRGLPVLGVGNKNSALMLKMFWHKLICINNKTPSQKPEVLVMLAIIKKSLLYTQEFKHLLVFNSEEKETRPPPLQANGHSMTASMLQSQANVYVQSLVQLGLLQVGNNPLVDCDIIVVVLQFKQLKNVNRLVKSLCQGKEVNTVLLMFDFVGNVTNIELKLNDSDCYMLDDVLGLRFKSSLQSIQRYFQRIFYLPINMYINGTSIASYRMDFGTLMPSDKYFVGSRKYEHSGSFAFNRFGKLPSARETRPIMDYTFSVDIEEVCWRQHKQPDQEPDHLEQKVQSPTSQSEVLSQLDLNAVGNKAVIHEVPKDRIVEKPVQWEPDSKDKISVASLDVGAELSNSEPEPDNEVDVQLSDRRKSDVPQEGSSLNRRRKKFTRLIENKYASQEFSMVEESSTGLDEEEKVAEEEEHYIKKCNESFNLMSVKEATEIVNSKPNSEKSLNRVEELKHKLQNNSKKNMQNEMLAREVATETVIKEHKNDDSKRYDTLNENENAKNEDKKKTSQGKTNELDPPPTEKVPKKSRKPKLINDEYLSDEVHQNIVDSNYTSDAPNRQYSRRTVSEDHSKDINQVMDTEQQHLIVKNSSKKFIKKTQTPSESKVGKKLSPRKPKDASTEMNEVNLSARWVEIGMQQNKMLEVTEKFIGDYNINKKDFGDDQRSTKKIKSKKLERSSENFEHFETNLTSENDNDNFLMREFNTEMKCVRRIAKKKTSQETLPEQEASEIISNLKSGKHRDTAEQEKSPEESSLSSFCEKSHKRSVRKPLVEDSCIEDMLGCDDIVQERSVKKMSSRKSVTQSATIKTKACEMDVAAQRRKNSKEKSINKTSVIKEVLSSNLDLEAKTSRLEVTVHMYDHLKSTEVSKESAKIQTKSMDQSVNTELDESMQKILMAGMQLQDDLKQKVLKYIESLGQQNENLKIDTKQLQDNLTESSSTEVNYRFKFQELEQHISVLEGNLQQFEGRTLEMQGENSKLAKEKMQLKKRITCMEKQIEQLQGQQSSDNNMQELIAQMRQQYANYKGVVRVKDHYKKQLRHAARRIHALKLAMYEKHVTHYKSNIINLRSILTKNSKEFEHEFGSLRKTETDTISTENESSAPLKDYLFGLSTQTIDKHKPGNHVDGTRIH